MLGGFGPGLAGQAGVGDPDVQGPERGEGRQRDRAAGGDERGGGDSDPVLGIDRRAAHDAGVTFDTLTSDTLELVRRRSADGVSYLFAVNHGEQDATTTASGLDLLTGEAHTGTATVPARGVRVLRLI